ncbi:MAG: hypothetical protein LBH20_09370 [Treponema sp.]|jgi:hypothetical protein|nr:hypothetical protein [Treponema sp.]
MKHFTLQFIQIAWVAEIIAILVYTMFAIAFFESGQINLWLQFIPIFGLLIAAQGTAAGAGPLAADSIKAKAEKEG